MAETVNEGFAVPTLKLLAEGQAPFSGKAPPQTGRNNYFKHAEWTPDGTSIITNSADNHIRTFIVPPDLLTSESHPLDLSSYNTIPSFEPVSALACYPGYDLQDPSTCLVLSTANEHPIRLNSALDARLLASYPLINPTTEAYTKPHSLLFAADGSRFLAGSTSLVSSFDISRPGEGPVNSFKTGPKNGKGYWSNPGTCLKGIVSALDVDQTYNVLAAGTLSRQIGLYDAGGEGECLGVFSTIGTKADDMVGGGGVSQVQRSRSGRYLYIAERRSTGFVVYDIRKTGQLLCWATGRMADTNQRMKVELAVDHEMGEEDIWAGGTDGMLRCWKAPYLQEGMVEPELDLKVHDNCVNSVSMHRTHKVLATASGSRAFDAIEHTKRATDIQGTSTTNSLRIWTDWSASK